MAKDASVLKEIRLISVTLDKIKLSVYLSISSSLLLFLVAFLTNQTYPLDAIQTPSTANSNEDNNNRDGFMEQDSIRVCCAWAANKLSDGVLTYKIINGGQTEQAAIRNAIREWESRIPNLKFSEVIAYTTEAPVDIQLKLLDAESPEVGKTITKFDRYGFTRYTNVTISKILFGNTLKIQDIQQVAKHEMGHILGLEHANSNGKLMSRKLYLDSDAADVISNCEVKAVLQANSWKLLENSTFPHHPYIGRIPCGTD